MKDGKLHSPAAWVIGIAVPHWNSRRGRARLPDSAIALAASHPQARMPLSAAASSVDSHHRHEARTTLAVHEDPRRIPTS
jgi:hypothetical protein